MRFYKAKVTKINLELGYIFMKTNTKKHEVFMPLNKEFIINNRIEINDLVQIQYKQTLRGFLASKLLL